MGHSNWYSHLNVPVDVHLDFRWAPFFLGGGGGIVSVPIFSESFSVSDLTTE